MPIHATPGGWVLETSSTAYAFGLNQAGLLAHRYWGARLSFPEDYPPAPNPGFWSAFNNAAQLTPEEFPGYEDVKFIEPCLKLHFADGVRNVLLRFVSAELGDAPRPELRILLRDDAYQLQATLHYVVHEVHDLIERFVTLANLGGASVDVERIWSAQWHLPQGGRYRLTHLVGRHMDEFALRREPLVEGVKVLESRRINTSHHHNPWFAADRGTADEEQGEVWFGALAWSGNWKLAAEVTDFGSTRISMGLNDWDFIWRLDPGKRFTTPSSFAGYSAEGFGGMSRRLHSMIREAVVADGDQLRQVFYNSWEATLFDVDEPSQAALAEIAAAVGVELFVLDDGWFHGRVDDTAALGDWWPDKQKFPNGLQPLIERVNGLGMGFGLWIEPEMVSPNSELYRTHPDWVLHYPGRPRTEARNQLILNMARVDVQDYLIGIFDRLLRDHNIAYIKWDMNRAVAEPGWPGAPTEPRELWARYVYGLYRVWGTLRERHPQVIWQSCSGGGGRADLGILRLANQIQLSDNIDPTLFLAMQEGASQLFPALVTHSWVADTPGRPYSLAFRFHVGMAGGILGIGGHLERWTTEEREEAAELIALYKNVRPVIQFGDQYRLWSAQSTPYSAVQYLARDRAEGVLFAFRTHMQPRAQLPVLKLRGLDPDARYSVEGFAAARSGRAWMHAGLQLELPDFGSTLRRIRRV
jgi:alpha-galactosidase